MDVIYETVYMETAWNEASLRPYVWHLVHFSQLTHLQLMDSINQGVLERSHL